MTGKISGAEPGCLPILPLIASPPVQRDIPTIQDAPPRVNANWRHLCLSQIDP